VGECFFWCRLTGVVPDKAKRCKTIVVVCCVLVSRVIPGCAWSPKTEAENNWDRFLQGRRPSCRPANNVKAVKGISLQNKLVNAITGCPQIRIKNYDFPGFSGAIVILFQRLSQQKVYIIMTFIYQGSFHINYYSACHPILLKSTVFVHQIHLAAYTLLDKVCTQIAKSVFNEVAQNSVSLPSSKKYLSIPGFAGLWPRCINAVHSTSKISHAHVSIKVTNQLLTTTVCNCSVTQTKFFWTMLISQRSSSNRAGIKTLVDRTRELFEEQV